MTYRAKHHDSCVRVLAFLKLLTKEDIDIKELEYDKKFKDIEAPETFLKYISTGLLFSGNIFSNSSFGVDYGIFVT